MTADVAAAFSTALAHHEAGRLRDAQALYRAILEHEPDHAESWHLLGLITAQHGEPAAGAAMIRRAMAFAPACAPHHNSLAGVYRMLGRDADAVAEYRAAAVLRPESAEIHNNLATALRAQGLHEEAVVEYRRAAGCAPQVAEIWYNLASALAERDQQPDVEACFRRAIALRPDFADALANYGRWLITQARWPEAEGWLQQAVRLAPTDARNLNNLGIVQQVLGRSQQAEASYRQAIAQDAGCADAHYNLGCLLAVDGNPDEATECHQAAIRADKLHGAARLAFGMAQLPVLYHSQAEVAARRDRYRTALADLAAAVQAPDVARSVAAAIGSSQPFFLPYQGDNDRALQADYGRLVCHLLEVTEAPRPLARPRAADERIRIGIVSGFFQDHTIFRLFLQGWLTQLDRERFELIAFHTGSVRDAETARCAELCDRFVVGKVSPDAWCDAVSGASPHVLLYPEIGMDPVAARLAAQRLAPVQCVSWGHPDTTGMPTMDYFLSSDLMEPSDGELHYTEQLIRLPCLGLYYEPDERPVAPLDRAALGLDPTVPIYWSGQALYKYLPEYDQLYPRIAAAVGACQFVFIGFAKSDAVTSAFRDRIHRAFAGLGLDAERYCVILPAMPQQRFIAAVALADVILDTPGWSGGRSTLDCLACNPAIVTWPGPMMRGRHTAAILNQIGCEATIARSLDQYVTLAVRLGLDAAWRLRLRGSVERGKHLAYRDTLPIRALEQFLAQAVARAGRARR